MRAPTRVSTRTLIRLCRVGQAICLFMSFSGFVMMAASAAPVHAEGRCRSVCEGENANLGACLHCEHLEHAVGFGGLAAGSALTLGGLLGAALLNELCHGLQSGTGVGGNGGGGRRDAAYTLPEPGDLSRILNSLGLTNADGTPVDANSLSTALNQMMQEGGEGGEPPEGHYYGGFGRGATGGEGDQPGAEGEGAGPRPTVSEGETPRVGAEGEAGARPATAGGDEGQTWRPPSPEGATLPPGPATDAARNRWQMLGADAEGRIYDASRNHVLNVDADGNVRDLSGRLVQRVDLADTPGAHVVRGYIDADGNDIRVSYGGTFQRAETDADGRTHYYPTDLPEPKGPPQPLTPEVAARWQAVGAGPSGEVRAPNGNVFGRIDADGKMWTVDGKPISGAPFNRAGRLEWFDTPDGQHWQWDSESGGFRSSQMPEGEPFRPLSEAEWQRLDAQRAPTRAEADQPMRPGPDPDRLGTAVEGGGERHFDPEADMRRRAQLAEERLRNLSPEEVARLRAQTGVGSRQPPAGAEGVEGAEGPRGLEGPEGAEGPRGVEGARGTAEGVEGAEGPRGVEGPEGAEGPRGVEGEGARAEADSGRTRIKSPEQVAAEGAARGGDTRVEGEGTGVRPGPRGETQVEGGEARASGAEGVEGTEGTRGVEGAEGAEGTRGVEGEGARAGAAEGGEARVSGAEGGEARVSGAEGESRPASEAEVSSRVSGAFSRTMDIKSVQDLYNKHIAEGKTPAEALSLAVAQTGAGNVVVDMGIVDPRFSAAAGALLPGEGMRNMLPEQAIQNWIRTGYGTLDALGESIGSSLGSGELDTSAFDRFAEGVANRPGADPFKGIGQLVEFGTEEIYRSDGGNLVSDIQRIYETGAGTEVLNESMTEFQQRVEQGAYGAPLQGINHLFSVAGDVIADPSTTVGQFFSDVGNIMKYGVGDGFWDEALNHTVGVIKETPIANTIYEGYHEIFSGVAQQGVTDFASEMAEGAYALAAETYDAAANSLADAANSTYNYIRSWF